MGIDEIRRMKGVAAYKKENPEEAAYEKKQAQAKAQRDKQTEKQKKKVTAQRKADQARNSKPMILPTTFEGKEED